MKTMSSIFKGVLKFMLFSICLLKLHVVYAQLTNNITFTNWQKEDGLPSNNINAVEKDSLGFLWIATKDGLCRYDGPDLTKIYRKKEGEQSADSGLHSDIIRTLLYDSAGYLWIGTTYGGLTRFNPLSNEWKTFRHNSQNVNSLSNDEVLTISEDSKKRIWIGTEYGLNLYDRATETFTQFNLDDTKAKTPVAKTILSIMEDKQGWIWAGTWADGLYLLLENEDGNYTTQNIRHFQPSLNKSANNVWALFQDEDGRYWIGTHGGGLLLMRLPKNASNRMGNQNWQPDFTTYNKESDNAVNIESNAVQTIMQDECKNLWVGTTFGLHKLAKELLPPLAKYEQASILRFETFLPSNDEITIVGNNIIDLYEDDQGIIWIATSSGLSQLNKYANQFKNHNFANLNFDIPFTPSLLIDLNKNIWVCRQYEGISMYRCEDDKLIQLKDNINHLLLGKRVSTINSPDGRWIYVGTELGITAIDIQTKKIIKYPTPSWFRSEIQDLFIKTILVDTEGIIWFGISEGLVRIDINNNNTFTLFEPSKENSYSISDNSISYIIQDSYGTIWVASYKGLNKIIDSNAEELMFESFFYNEKKPEQGPVNNQVVYLKEIDDFLYIGTTSGICRYSYLNCQFETFEASEYKFLIRSIEEGINKDIWVSTNEGIFNFDHQEKSFQIFDTKDGLKNTDFQQGSSFKDTDNNIFFAHPNGLTYFSSETISKNTTPPPVYITEIEVMSTDGIKVIEGIQKDRIELSHKVYRLSVNFAALNYNRSDKNRYKYKLVGFENQWNVAKFGTPIIYTKLEPKEYQLEIKAANNDGVWNEEGDVMTIIQYSPYWKTWWFNILVIMFIAIIILSLSSWNTYKIRKHNEELQQYNKALNVEIINRKKVEKQLQDYNKELMRSNKDLEQFAYVASHDLKEPLRVISSFSGLLSFTYANKLNEEAKLHFGFIEESIARMFKVIDSLLTYSTVGHKDTVYSAINLNQMIKNKVKDLSQLIKDKNVHIKIEDLPEIIGHQEQIGMVFFNLIHNAIIFNTKKQPVVLVNEEKEDDNYWKFSVADNGIGIEPRYQEQIFGIFKRLHSKKEYEGSGIGLSVCQKIILRHQGVIWLKSELGKGTTFYFTIKKNLAMHSKM